MISNIEIGVGSLWSVYSINCHMLMTHKIKYNDWKGLWNLIKILLSGMFQKIVKSLHTINSRI